MDDWSVVARVLWMTGVLLLECSEWLLGCCGSLVCCC